MQADGHHGGSRAEHAHDAAMAILMERSHDLGGITELGGLERRCVREQDLALAHGHIHRAEVEERMPEGEHAVAIVIGDRAQAGDAHIARDQHAGHGIARLKRVLPAGDGLGAVERGAGAALDGTETELPEERPELLENGGIEAGESQGRVDGRHQGRLG